MSWIAVIAIVSVGFVCAFALSEWVVKRRDTGLPDTDDGQDWVP